MIKNTGSQKIGGQLITAADGSDFTGAVTVYITGDAGSQALGSVGSGVCTHEGNGYHTYAPAQAETNYDLIAFTFIGSGAISSTVQVFTIIAQQTGDSFGRIGATGSGLTSLALASVVGALADGAADGAVTSADTLMQYLKQLINILIGGPGVVAFPAEAAPGNGVSLAEVIRAIHVDVTGLNGDVMRGTNSANTTTPPTVTQIQAEIEENGASVIDTIRDYIENVTYGLSALKTLIDAIPTVTPDAAGTAPTSAEIKTAIEAAESHLTLIKAVTDNLPNAGALTTIGTDTARLTAARAGVLTDWINAGRLDAILDLILGDTNELQTDDIPATLATLSTHDAAAVKTAIEAGGGSLALIKAVTDALTAAAATKLALSAGNIITGTVSHDNTAATTTVFYSDDITEATADHYNGRIVFFTSGELIGQAKDITDYKLDAGEGKFTVTALTEAPADNVTFIIV